MVTCHPHRDNSRTIQPRILNLEFNLTPSLQAEILELEKPFGALDSYPVFDEAGMCAVRHPTGGRARWSMSLIRRGLVKLNVWACYTRFVPHPITMSCSPNLMETSPVLTSDMTTISTTTIDAIPSNASSGENSRVRSLLSFEGYVPYLTMSDAFRVLSGTTVHQQDFLVSS